MGAITEDLLKELKNAKDIKGFLDSHENEFLKETPVSFLILSVSVFCNLAFSSPPEYSFSTKSPSRQFTTQFPRPLRTPLISNS